MDNEAEIIRDTQTLHSDMQTLVYENYNKFISATDTIRKVSPRPHRSIHELVVSRYIHVLFIFTDEK